MKSIPPLTDKFKTAAVCYSALALAILPPLVRILFMSAAPQWGIWIYRALTFLVISCPCALVISIPLSFFAGIGGASREGVLVKGSNYLETLSQTRYVVFDKTGTMTEGVFEVAGVYDNTLDREKVLEYAALAESSSSHPISRSLQKAYGKEIDRTRVTDVEEISGHGITAKVDGVSVAAGNYKLMKKLGLSYSETDKVGTIVHIAIDGSYEGYILISDKIKPTSAAAIKALKKAGIKGTIMLTGDSRTVADSVAAELGIDEVYSELLPGDKVAKVEELLARKGSKEKLAFVGDGINDAPVLSRADIGIAMGARREILEYDNKTHGAGGCRRGGADRKRQLYTALEQTGVFGCHEASGEYHACGTGGWRDTGVSVHICVI